MAKVTNKAVITSAHNLFGKSYGLVRKNLNTYAFVYAIPAAMMIAGVIQLIVDNQRHGWDWGHAFSSSIIGSNVTSNTPIQTASNILYGVLMLGSIISYFLAVVLNLRVSEGKSPTLRSVWNEVTKDWLWAKLFWLGVLTILIMVVGLVLFIIPFIIFLWRLYLAPYILVDQKTKVFDALSISWNMTKGYAWPIYSIILFSIVLSLPSVIPIAGGLVAFILGTAYAAAAALRYQEIKKVLSTGDRLSK